MNAYEITIRFYNHKEHYSGRYTSMVSADDPNSAIMDMISRCMNPIEEISTITCKPRETE